MTIHSEIFVGHVTESDLATQLEVGIKSLWRLISYLSSEARP
jgi:hypothetical protein